MDVYSSLLNLNFMASLRTGNLIVDMLIAVLIPVISGMIHHFFRNTWPDLVSRCLNLFMHASSTTLIQPPVYDTYGSVSIDVCENSVLNEAVTQYVSRKVKPTYEKGAYRYKRLPGNTTEDVGTTLVDVLQKRYCVQTVPAEDSSVLVAPALKFSVVPDSGGKGGGEGGDGGGGRGDEDRGGGGGGRGGSRSKIRDKAISLVSTQTSVMAKDAATAFIGEAWGWYKDSVRDTTDRSRYLLQPLVEKAAAGNELMQCQSFPLSQEKTFNTLFFPEKSRLINLIDQFQAKTGKFAVPGFPHKLVLLLYGPPGTGKTSLVKAIAAYTGRNLLSIPLSRVQTNRQLLQYMFDARCRLPGRGRSRYASDSSMRLPAKKVIYVLEDIDAASGIVLRDSWKDVATEAATATAPAAAVAAAKEEEITAVAATTEGAAEEGDRKEKKVEVESPHASDKGSDDEENKASRADEEGTDADKSGTDDDGSEGDDDAEEGSESSSDKKQKKKKKKSHDKVAISSTFTTDKLSMQGVLGALNGILNAPGRIVVMTTNHIEHLDPALTRPGVVTMKLHMAHFSPECAVDMVKHYFNSASDSGVVPQELLHQVYKEVAQRQGRAFSPAEVEQLCAENDSVEGVISALRKGSARDVF